MIGVNCATSKHWTLVSWLYVPSAEPNLSSNFMRIKRERSACSKMPTTSVSAGVYFDTAKYLQHVVEYSTVTRTTSYSCRCFHTLQNRLLPNWRPQPPTPGHHLHTQARMQGTMGLACTGEFANYRIQHQPRKWRRLFGRCQLHVLPAPPGCRVLQTWCLSRRPKHRLVE
jgi:hypothetical protein